jgi:hypothetical protein
MPSGIETKQHRSRYFHVPSYFLGRCRALAHYERSQEDDSSEYDFAFS